MRLESVNILAGLVLAAGLLVPVAGSRADEVSTEEIDEAIRRTVENLISRQSEDGSWGENNIRPDKYFGGYTALVTYALLEAGEAPNRPHMKKALEWLREQETSNTYVLSFRVNCWAKVVAMGYEGYDRLLEREADQLIHSMTREGAYGYVSDGKSDAEGYMDNSNTQLAVLAVWNAQQAGVEVPIQYWRVLLDHWKDKQHANGGWSYRWQRYVIGKYPEQGEVVGTMTAAGLASLFICIDNLSTEAFLDCDGRNEIKRVDRALEWFDKNYEPSIRGESDWFTYYLYGISRVGMASGYKFFGETDWYSFAARELLRRGGSKGEWRGNYGVYVNTAFALLFLARGRAPVAFNQLEYDGDWNNRPRALANLTRYLGRMLEIRLSWQIVNLEVSPRRWHDASVLVILGSKKPRFSEEDLAKLRTFVYQGGTILSITECEGTAFDHGMREVYARLFPLYEMGRVARDSSLYEEPYRLPGAPRISVLRNGARPLAFHIHDDVAMSWQKRAYRVRGRDFEVMANLLRRVVGKYYDLRPRGSIPWPKSEEEESGQEEEIFRQRVPERTVKVARLRFPGNDNPEPLAWLRAQRILARQGRVGVSFVESSGKRKAPTVELVDGSMDLGLIEISELADSEADLAVLSGTGELKLTPRQEMQLRLWVEKGGTLLVEAVGGDDAFARSARKRLSEWSGPEALRELAADSKLYTLGPEPIEKVRYQMLSGMRMGKSLRAPRLVGMDVGGRLAVIFSEEDLSVGMLGITSGAVHGYQPPDAMRLIRNILMLVDDSSKQQDKSDAEEDSTAPEIQDEAELPEG